MKKKIVNELHSRCNLLIKNAKPNEINTGMSGSRVRFCMALAPIGYPGEKEEWMTDNYVKPLMDEDTYFSDEYDALFESLHKKAMEKVNK